MSTTLQRGNSAITALVAILVIAVVAFGIWYVMQYSAEQKENTGAGLEVNLGDMSGDQESGN